jgi:hypothetical protein
VAARTVAAAEAVPTVAAVEVVFTVAAVAAAAVVVLTVVVVVAAGEQVEAEATTKAFFSKGVDRPAVVLSGTDLRAQVSPHAAPQPVTKKIPSAAPTRLGSKTVYPGISFQIPHTVPALLLAGLLQQVQRMAVLAKTGKPLFELHVWAWRDNPNGAFVDWNTKVSCQGE